MACALLSVLPVLVASPAEPRRAVLDVHLTLVDPKTYAPSGHEELGLCEEKRLSGNFTKADSIRWLSKLTPGVQIAWTDPSTHAVDFTLTARCTADTINAGITWTYGIVRQEVPIVASHRGKYRYRWNLDDDEGTRVGPGVYCLDFVRRGTTTPFYVVVR